MVPGPGFGDRPNVTRPAAPGSTLDATVGFAPHAQRRRCRKHQFLRVYLARRSALNQRVFCGLFLAPGKPMKIAALISCLVLCASFASSASARPLAEKLEADMEMAEHSILASLAVHKSSGSKSLCSQIPYACAGADGAELGLALIGGSKSPAAPRHLAGLSRFRMDGALSEDYKCYVAAQGNSVVQAASKLDAKRLAGQCLSEFSAFKRRAGSASFDVAPESICSSVSDIQKSLREVAGLAKAGAGCDGV